MAEKKTSIVSSPLFGALNNIVPIKRSARTMSKTQSSFQGFLRFMDVEIKNMQAIKMPSKRKLKEISNINLASTFGRPGNLLTSLASGALDAAGFIGDMFGRGKKPNAKAGQKVPTKGPKVRLGGLKALGVVNAAFAGLDFATGLQEGESVGKAAAGAGGALAGSLLGGAIGQAIIPVPGLGFVVGSMAGNFLGGYLADRGYEAATGTGSQDVKQKTTRRLKEQEKKQKELAAAAGVSLTLPEVLDKFDTVVTRFERAIQNMASGTQEIGDWEEGETDEDKIDYRPEDAEEFTPGAPTGSGDEVFPLVGGRPTFTMGAGLFNASRGDRRHSAQDIGVDPNTPVVASRSGTVLQSYSSGYGSVGGAVVIRYDNGQQGLYGHTIPNVKVGDKVKAGDRIAKVAPDGNNTHLHYMRKDTRGNYIDPLPILQGSKSGVPIVKGQKQESKKDLEKQSTMSSDTGDTAMAAPQNKMVPTPTKPQQTTSTSRQELTNVATSNITTAISQVPQQNVVPTSTNVPMSMVTPATTQLEQINQPARYEIYPDYNQPQSSVTIMPMIVSSGGSQRPMVISSGSGGGGGGTVIMPPPPQGVLLNSLFKTMLLTNLSAM
jgi:murein DD-endopeptidase MepM/ murein hydrolase activator NlpD